MRVREIQNINDLLNIQDDETLIFKMDYQIIEYYKWIYDDEGHFKNCIYPYTVIKINNQELLNEINNKLDLNFVINENINVTPDIGYEVHMVLNSLHDNGWKLRGSIGSERIWN